MRQRGQTGFLGAARAAARPAGEVETGCHAATARRSPSAPTALRARSTVEPDVSSRPAPVDVSRQHVGLSHRLAAGGVERELAPGATPPLGHDPSPRRSDREQHHAEQRDVEQVIAGLQTRARRPKSSQRRAHTIASATTRRSSPRGPTRRIARNTGATAAASAARPLSQTTVANIPPQQRERRTARRRAPQLARIAGAFHQPAADRRRYSRAKPIPIRLSGTQITIGTISSRLHLGASEVPEQQCEQSRHKNADDRVDR